MVYFTTLELRSNQTATNILFHSVSVTQSVLCQSPPLQIDMFSSDSYSHGKLWPTLHFLQSQPPLPLPTTIPGTTYKCAAGIQWSETTVKNSFCSLQKALWFFNQERSKSRCPQITYIYKPNCTEQRYAEIELMTVSNQWGLLICTYKRN